MSVKGSWSRVKDARRFGREHERIFRRKKFNRLRGNKKKNAPHEPPRI